MGLQCITKSKGLLRHGFGQQRKRVMARLDQASWEGHIMTKVIIKDELMGTGKSTRMIEEINNSHPDQRYIVVVPFLAEAHRYAGTLSDPDSGDEDAPLAYQTPLRDENTGTG